MVILYEKLGKYCRMPIPSCSYNAKRHTDRINQGNPNYTITAIEDRLYVAIQYLFAIVSQLITHPDYIIPTADEFFFNSRRLHTYIQSKKSYTLSPIMKICMETALGREIQQTKKDFLRAHISIALMALSVYGHQQVFITSTNDLDNSIFLNTLRAIEYYIQNYLPSLPAHEISSTILRIYPVLQDFHTPKLYHSTSAYVIGKDLWSQQKKIQMDKPYKKYIEKYVTKYIVKPVTIPC